MPGMATSISSESPALAVGGGVNGFWRTICCAIEVVYFGAGVAVDGFRAI